MLQKLWVKSFRNLKERSFSFTPRVPYLIIGDNNQGKTNFLEAIYVLGNGEAANGVLLSNLIQFGASDARLGADYVYHDTRHRLYLKILPEGKKEGVLDDVSFKSFTKIRRQLAMTYLSADILRIFQESPDFRRKVMDRFSSVYFNAYAGWLKQYERLMRQKNSGLKDGISADMLRVYNQQLVELGAKIYQTRREALNIWVSQLAPLLSLIDDKWGQTVSLHYHVTGEKVHDISVPDYASWLSDKLRENEAKEMAVGHGLYGIHRDDFSISIEGKSLIEFFSRGINRTVAILLELAKLISIEEKFGQFPILLLDDTFAELDKTMKTRLMAMLVARSQVFYASVLDEDRELCDNVTILSVTDGEIYDG